MGPWATLFGSLENWSPLGCWLIRFLLSVCFVFICTSGTPLIYVSHRLNLLFYAFCLAANLKTTRLSWKRMVPLFLVLFWNNVLNLICCYMLHCRSICFVCHNLLFFSLKESWHFQVGFIRIWTLKYLKFCYFAAPFFYLLQILCQII